MINDSIQITSGTDGLTVTVIVGGINIVDSIGPVESVRQAHMLACFIGHSWCNSIGQTFAIPDVDGSASESELDSLAELVRSLELSNLFAAVQIGIDNTKYSGKLH